MTTRRKFLKGLASLPALSLFKPAVAEPTPEPVPEPDNSSDFTVICPHCWEWSKPGHSCAGYRAWLAEQKKQGKPYV